MKRVMSRDEIADKVKKILIDLFELGEEELNDDASIYEELGLDSLDSVDLVVALEKEFDFKVVRNVDEEKIRSMRLLKDVYAFVEQKLS